jgi:hypothetical protein
MVGLCRRIDITICQSTFSAPSSSSRTPITLNFYQSRIPLIVSRPPHLQGSDREILCSLQYPDRLEGRQRRRDEQDHGRELPLSHQQIRTVLMIDHARDRRRHGLFRYCPNRAHSRCRWWSHDRCHWLRLCFLQAILQLYPSPHHSHWSHRRQCQYQGRYQPPQVEEQVCYCLSLVSGLD